MKRLCMVGAMIAYVAVSSFAAHPLATLDAGMMGSGSTEIEWGYERVEPDGTARAIGMCLCVTHGVSDQMDMCVGIPSTIDPQTPERFGDAELGVKFGLLPDRLAIHFSNELGINAYGFGAIYSHEVAPVMIHLNLGYAASGNVNVAGEMNYSAAIAYPWEDFEFAGEVLGLEASGLDTWMVSLRHCLTEMISCDIGYGNSFGESQHVVAAGIVVSF